MREPIDDVLYTLRAYQGMYFGGGEFSALGKNGGLNSDLFYYWNSFYSEKWLARADSIYREVAAFARENEEYSYLLDNLIQPPRSGKDYGTW